MPENAIVLFEDETDLVLFPPLCAAWAKRGQSKTVSLCGCNARRVVSGTLNAKTGHLLLVPQGRQRALDFQNFLEIVRWHYRSQCVVMILDEDSSHTAFDSQECASELGIELWWLPKRSPELNPMERLWQAGKKEVCANYQHPDIDEQTQEFIGYLLALSPWQTLVTSGITSDRFWLLQ